MGEMANILKFSGEVCRGCGGKGANSPIAIYGSAYEICTGIMVSSSDGLPDKLCKNCVNKMIMAYDFRISCNCTEEHLSIVKQERREENPETRSTEINPNQLHSDSEDGEITIEETKITPLCFDDVPFRNPDFASLDSDMSPASSRTVNPSGNHAGSSVSAAFDMLPTADNTDSNDNQTKIDHSTRPKIRCNNCSKEYIYKTSFRRHQALHARDLLSPESSVDKSRTTLDMPRVIEGIEGNTDSEANQTKIDHSTRPKLRCNNCSKEYIYKTSFRRHQALHARDLLSPESSVDKSRTTLDMPRVIEGIEGNTDSEANQTTIDHSTRPKFRCNNCSKEYFFKTSFRRHQELYDCKQPYTCVICLRHFSKKKYLKAHFQKVHPGSTQQQQKTWLKSPRFIHKNTKQKKCRICGAQFMRQMSFYYHMLHHHGKKPFCCNACNAEFTAQSSLNRHRRNRCPKSMHDVMMGPSQLM